MSIRQLTSSWIAKSSDASNPILVKETRQSLKSRQFVATFMLLLAASWLVSSFFMLLGGQSLEFGPVAMRLFFAYYTVLAFAIFVIVPFGAFRSLLNESEHNTFELLSITTLSPRQIVWGKLLSAVLQLFIYYSAISPFMAFTALLNGFDLASFTFVLLMSMFASMVMSMIALMASTFSRKRQWQAMSSLVLLGGLVWVFFGGCALVISILQFGVPFTNPQFWWAIAAVIVTTFSYVALCQQITTAQLTFASGNRSSGIRITASVQVWLYMVALVAFGAYEGLRPGDDELAILASIPLVHITIVSLFLATEADALSRRIRRDLPDSVFLRVIFAPFLPGGSRGFLYLLLHVVACGVAVLIAKSYYGIPQTAIIDTLLPAALYVVIYIGAACALSRWGHHVSSDFKPAHARVLIILGVLATFIIPFFPRVMEWVGWRSGFNWFDVLNPAMALQHIEQGGQHSSYVLGSLLAAAGGVVLLNAKALAGGLTSIVNADVKSRSRVVAPRNERAASSAEA